MEDTGFWDSIVLRKNAAGEYEQCHGHARVEAAKKVLGPDHLVNLPVIEADDALMLKMMALENAPSEGDSIAAQADTVAAVSEFLRDHHEACISAPWPRKSRAAPPHEAGCWMRGVE